MKTDSDIEQRVQVSVTQSPTLDSVPASNATSRDLRRIAKKLKETLAERDNLIIQATREGASLRDIGADLGVNHVTVRNLLTKIQQGDASEQHRERTGIDEGTTRF